MANQPTKYSKFLIGAASAALVASAVAPVASAADFKDTKGNTHEAAIDALSDAGVITGYPDGTFLPNKTLTRSDVVKLMGKWLVAEGSTVPTDYKTNPRFADLKSTSNDELLKFAAVVFDNGVFVGTPDGKLNATGDITRENMAVVLVRAFDRVHDIDLASYVAGKDFKKDVTDLGKAKAEARPAIDVLDYFDITNPAAPAFNPKLTTTRGQFATFLYKTTKADFSDVTPGVVVGVAAVKAVNATTVEVTFKEKVTAENLNSLDFKIDGLTVSNAVVKQTDDKTVVLTTAVQKGGEKYTVTLNNKAIGSFVGISVVLPKSVSFIDKSQQGVYGQEVTVRAEVTLEEGQTNKAGIPVTFNIDSNADAAGGQFAKDQTAEVVTNADGIATYSYTQYNPSNSTDVVTAYATGKANVRASAMVYWGNTARLAVTDVTTAASIANSATKVYQVKSTENRNGYVFVTFKENQGVTPDKVTNGVTFTDANVYSVDANGNFSSPITNGVPFEVTTGGHQVAVVKLNAEGVGNFTLTGADATVTPVVYAGTYTPNTSGNITASKDANYDGTDLQAVANPAVFSLSQVADMTIVALGKANAAARNADSAYATVGQGTGGREYKIALKGKDGKVAPANSNVVVYFEQATTGNSNRVNHNVTLISGGITHAVSAQPTGSTNLNTGITLKTNSKGEIEFSVHGANNDFVTPIAVYDNGKTAGVLDTSDLKAVGETTYFGAAVIGGSRIDILDEKNEVVADSAVTSNVATIRYVSVDQNGFDYYNNSSREFDATFVLSDAFTVYNTDVDVVSKENNRTTYKVKATNGVATLKVTKTSTGSGQVSYTASTTNNVIAPQSGVVKFGTAADRAIITGQVTGFDTTKNEVTILPTNSTLPVTLSYAGADWYYKGSTAGVTETYFESKLANGVEITYNKATETTKAKFDITKDAVESNTKAALQSAITSAQNLWDNAVVGTDEGQYSSTAKNDLDTAIGAAITVLNNAASTPGQISTANTNLATAVDTFKKAVVGNQKTALTNAIKDAEALLASVKAKAAPATGFVEGEVTDSKYNALKSEITLAKAILADTGASQSDNTTAIAALKTDVDAVKADVKAFADDKASLVAAIKTATTAYDAAVTGGANGQWLAKDKATFKVAIDAAKAVLADATSINSKITSSTSTLATATTDFGADKLVVTLTKGAEASTSLVLTFSNSAGQVIANTETITPNASETTATVADITATANDEVTITLTAIDAAAVTAGENKIVFPITVNGKTVELTVTGAADGTYTIEQNVADFFVVTP